MLKQRPGLALYMASDVVEHLGESQTQVQDFTDGNTMVYLIWVNYNDLTATSLESWLVRGIIPKWPYFRLVKYYNLPRFDQFWSYLIIVFRSPCSPLILSCAKHVLHVWPWLTITDLSAYRISCHTALTRLSVPYLNSFMEIACLLLGDLLNQ